MRAAAPEMLGEAIATGCSQVLRHAARTVSCGRGVIGTNSRLPEPTFPVAQVLPPDGGRCKTQRISSPKWGICGLTPQDRGPHRFLSGMNRVCPNILKSFLCRPSRESESGQTIVLLAVMLLSLLGICGLVIDGGNWMVNRRDVQNAADAAALAGASQIPFVATATIDTARAQYAKNGLPGDTVTVTGTTYLTSGDSVTVTASRKVDTFFTSIFGLDQVTETATARATVESFTTINGPGAMPWGVLSGSYVPGQPYSIYTKMTGNANNGALSLPYVNGANCPVPNGANSYEDEINGTLQPCPITVGDLLDTKTGDNSGPTAKGPELSHHHLADRRSDRRFQATAPQRH